MKCVFQVSGLNRDLGFLRGLYSDDEEDNEDKDDHNDKKSSFITCWNHKLQYKVSGIIPCWNQSQTHVDLESDGENNINEEDEDDNKDNDQVEEDNGSWTSIIPCLKLKLKYIYNVMMMTTPTRGEYAYKSRVSILRSDFGNQFLF